MASLIVTLLGPDRRGLVRTLSETVARHGGSWAESHMARLAGQFAGILLIDAASSEHGPLAAALRDLAAEGMQVEIRDGGAAEAAGRDDALAVEVVGHDRPGIVRDVTQVLARLGANIEELATSVTSGSFSGEAMFRADLRVSHAPEVTADAIRAALEHLGNELMVDIRPG
jgi:glycine cleavage system regulatory protein